MDVSVELVKCLAQSVVNIRAAVPRQHPSARILGTERMGSGVVVDPAGLVLTVNYVVMGASSIDVAPIKGRRMKAEVVGQDFEIGLALLRVKRQRLPAATVGPQLPERGDEVVAVASTGPQERPVAGGVVTYVGEFEAYWEYLLDRGIVSTAPNPGFGGGGLFTPAGRLVGVLSLNLNEVARSSLAIPVEHYVEHAEELVRYGRVASRPRRAWLGVFAHAVEDGVIIAGMVPDGPGARAGLQEGDLIVSLNAEEVSSRRELYMSLWRHEPGERLTLEVLRDNKVRRLEVMGGDRADFYRQL
jgi:S1-C subfamily serine protease